MKIKKALYTLLIVSIIFTACKKEEDTPVAINGCMDTIATNYNASATSDDGSCIYSILGVWTPTSLVLDTSQTVTIAGEIVYELDFQDGNGPQVLTYSGSETMTPEEAEIEGDAEFTADGKFITDDDTSSYTYSNNVITITDEEQEITVFNCSVTSTNLSLTMENSQDTAFNEPGLMMLGFPNGDITISSNHSFTINCSRSSVLNTNINQRVGNTNHSWFVKPKLDNSRIINKLKE